MTTSSSNIIKKPEQLRLWPTEEADSIIYDASAAYRRLEDAGQRIVRAYLLELDRCGDWPTYSKVAASAGVSRSTVTSYLGDKGSEAWQAITDVLVATRDQLARRSTVAIPALATLIMRQFLPGEGRLPRQTSTLTKVELDVLRLASAMGGCAVGADGAPISLMVEQRLAASNGDAAAVRVIASSAPAESLHDMLAKLRGDAPQQAMTEIEPESPKDVQSAGEGSSAVAIGGV